MNLIHSFLVLIACSLINLRAISQVITSNPEFPTVNDEVTITFNLNQCDCSIQGDIYAHTGVITSESTSDGDWKHVKTDWGENTEDTKLTKINDSLYSLVLTPDVTTYYSLNPEEQVLQLAFVFRNSTGSQQTINLYYDVYEPGLSVVLNNPTENLIVEETDTIVIEASVVSLGTTASDSICLYIDSDLVHVSYEDTLHHQIVTSGSGKHWIIVKADNPDYHAIDSLFYFIRSEISIEDVPEGLIDGINYIDSTSVTLVLFAPYKENVFVLGDFNSWELSNDYLMKQSTDGKRFWLPLTGLTAGEEYAYQYLINGNLKIADPYTEKILDPVNDPEIPSTTYPDLKAYPTGLTTGIVSILQTAQEEYPWQEFAFLPPEPEELVIYEMLIRDFVATRDIKTITDTLNYLESIGINAIELMPVNEFEGNNSWGYNPSFYFAFDKYYGQKQDFQKFIEECHKRGIAVIIDMVLNHSYSQSPMVQMYQDSKTGVQTEESPWFNDDCPHEPYCWGTDFNHESLETQKFVDRVNRFWLTEYNIDGFRFDFTKGFTNKTGDGWAYDASRIALLKRMTDSIKAVKSNAIVIFEHLSENTEEKELAEYSILLWGKMTDNYNEATMGYNESNKSDLSNISYLKRDWNKPHLVGYMESHDEERLMYKNITWGAASGSYDVKELATALQRMETAAAFFFTVPGPKMVWQFGELGYDYSINNCTNGTVDDDCRLDPKPLIWDYLEEAERIRLKAVFTELIKLRNNHEVFQTDNFDLDVKKALKSIHLNGNEMNVTIVGNFDLHSGKIDPAFQHTGTWYDYFAGTSLDITDVNDSISLRAGEYKIYTDTELETPSLPPGTELPNSIIHKRTNNNNPFEVYPNPTNEVIIIKSADRIRKTVQLKIYNAIGAQIFSKQVETNTPVSPDFINRYGSQVLYYQIETENDITQGKLIIE